MKKRLQWLQAEIDALKKRADEAGRSVGHQIELELAVQWDLALACEQVYLKVVELEFGMDWDLRG